MIKRAPLRSCLALQSPRAPLPASVVDVDLGGAVAAEPEEDAAVLGDAGEAAEHEGDELHEGTGGEEAVGASLVLRADALYLQCLGQLVEAAMQVVAELHQVLDVPHVGEVDLHAARPSVSQL